MSRTTRRLLLRYRRTFAVLLVGLAVLLIVERLSPRTEVGRTVVVAASDLSAGTRVSARDVAVVRLPRRAVPGHALSSPAAALGRTLVGPMRAGQVLTDLSLVGRSLIAGYPPGIVAAPVQVRDADVVRLLRVGDRLDVFAARSDAALADLVVRSAVVLALPRAGGSALGALGEGDGEGGIVILAVTEGEASALAQAAATAPVSVALTR